METKYIYQINPETMDFLRQYYSSEKLDAMLEDSLEETDQYAEPQEYFNKHKFLTIIVKTNGSVMQGLYSATERSVLMGSNQSYPAYGIISYPDRSVPISFMCSENIRLDKGKKHYINSSRNCLVYNKKATLIANELDARCEHWIEGSCAFIFDENDEKSNLLVQKIMNLHS